MWDQEKKHLSVMNKMQAQHRVRPTILWEVAQVAGYGLGVVTALMGKEAAMACTEAVETVIGEHYQECVFFKTLVHNPHPLSIVNSKPLKVFPAIRACTC